LGHLGLERFQPLLHRLKVVAKPDPADPEWRDRHSLLGQLVGQPRLAPGGWSIAIATAAASLCGATRFLKIGVRRDAIVDNCAATSTQTFADGSNAIRDRRSPSRRHRLPWLNAVEGFFALLTNRRLQPAPFRPVADLQAAIDRFLDEHSLTSKPFVSTKGPDQINAAVRRGAKC
jgi:hypothetical protein